MCVCVCVCVCMYMHRFACLYLMLHLSRFVFLYFYLHKNTVLSTDEFEVSGIKVYPNPTKDNWKIQTKNDVISHVIVYDLLGKKVMSLFPKTTDAIIEGTSLKPGVYFTQIKTDKGISSVKLVKE